MGEGRRNGAARSEHPRRIGRDRCGEGGMEGGRYRYILIRYMLCLDGKNKDMWIGQCGRRPVKWEKAGETGLLGVNTPAEQGGIGAGRGEWREGGTDIF